MSRGFAELDRDAARAERARSWLVAHPSAEPDVDAIWRLALDGSGPLVDWRRSGSTAETWRHATLPLHTVLASHPFPDLDVWSIHTTSLAS